MRSLSPTSPTRSSARTRSALIALYIALLGGTLLWASGWWERAPVVASQEPQAVAPAPSRAADAAVPDAPTPVAEPLAEGSVPSAEAALPREEREQLERYRATQDADERSDLLLDIALSEDPAVLPVLLDELRAAEPARRPELIDAVVQYASRDAVPVLRELAEQASTLEERRQLVEAADYLMLPSLTEVRGGVVSPDASQNQLPSGPFGLLIPSSTH